MTTKAKPNSVCRCVFKRKQDSAWEPGLAITTAHGLSDTVCIVPDTAKTPADVLQMVWDYRLDWTHSIDCDYLPTI